MLAFLKESVTLISSQARCWRTYFSYSNVFGLIPVVLKVPLILMCQVAVRLQCLGRRRLQEETEELNWLCGIVILKLRDMPAP